MCMNYTKRKQGLRFLNSKPRRSLYRLRLKFVQTTRVVCTDYSWSLQKVLCTYKFKCAYLLRQVRVITKISATYWHCFSCGRRRAPTGRYSCIAQGANPGLIVSTHFLSLVGAALIMHEEKTRLAFPKLKTSAKSVQTTAEVCADYTCSLYRLQLKSPESTTYLQI